ncbi:hypothetical protein N2152v2_010929 [Parachlorella kessleri]
MASTAVLPNRMAANTTQPDLGSPQHSSAGGTDVEQQNRAAAASESEGAPDPQKAPVIIVQPDSEVVLAFKDLQLSEGDDGFCGKEKVNVRDDLERRDSAYVEAAEESGTCNPAGCT